MSTTIWGQAVPGSVSFGTVAETTFGLFFALSESQPLTAIWYYSAPSETVLPVKCAIFDVATEAVVTGTENDAPSWSGAAGSGWVSCTYDGSVTLDTRTGGYCAAIQWPGGSKGFVQISFPVTSGIITAPAADSHSIGNAPFRSDWAYPNTTPSPAGLEWFVDVQVGAATPPEFEAVFESTAADGTQTWNVTSRYNGPDTSVLRILPPSSPDASRPHSFLIALPVDTGTSTTFGDPIAVIGDDLAAHNAYNATVVVPSFGIQPWYADNPDNTQQSQETFILQMVSWLATSEFASGGEQVYLIGFSKSGIGGQALQLKHPDVFAKTASWDFPAMMTDYDGTDPTYGGTVGGDPSDSYGTSANFTANYQLSSANLTAWISGQDFTTVKRLWIGGYFAFQADVAAYKPVLDSLGIRYDGAWSTLDASHAWHDDWVSAALASLFAVASGSGLLMAGII